MSSTFEQILRLITDGEPVDAESVNRLATRLDDRDRFLLALINQLTQQQSVLRRNVALASDVQVGQPVYFNTTNNRFEKALAQAVVQDGALLVSPGAIAVGLVHTKHNTTLGDLLIGGYADIDLSAAVDGAVDPGLYFLSAATAGKMSLQEPAVSLPVAFVDADGGVYFRPAFTDIYSSHQHYRYELRCVTAGTPSLGGGRWTIGSEDDAVEGWLPADNAIFGGNAPAGALFGYNISASPLATMWPPMPLESVAVEWFLDDGTLGGKTIDGVDGLVVVNHYGIWWMSNCEDYVPWPADYDPGTSTTTTTTTSPPGCPPEQQMRMVLFFSRTKFQTTKTVVTSLASNSDLLEVVCANDPDTEESTGPLLLKLNLSFALSGTTDDDSGIAITTITEDGKFDQGPVVNGLKAGASNVGLSSAGGADANGYHKGPVTISVTQGILGAELSLQHLQLLNSEEVRYKDTIAIELPDGRDSGFRSEINLPVVAGVTTTEIAIRFWVLVRANGDVPTLTMGARVYPRPTTPTALPTVDSAVTIDVSAGAGMTTDQYVEITSDTVTVLPGQMVQFTLLREADGGDEFAGDIQIIRPHAVVISAS